MKPTFITLTIILTLTSGCSGLPKLAKELAKDPATATIRVTTIYGTIDFKRSNPSTNHSATILTDGSIVIENVARPDSATDTLLKRMVAPPSR